MKRKEEENQEPNTCPGVRGAEFAIFLRIDRSKGKIEAEKERDQDLGNPKRIRQGIG